MLTTMTASGSHIKLRASAHFTLPGTVIYLNTCGMAPRLKAVDRAAQAALDVSARPWEAGANDWIEQTEQLRAAAARWLGTDPDALAYTPSVSYAMAVAARNCPLAERCDVLVLAGEYPSNRMVWQAVAARSGAMVSVCERRVDQTWTDAVLADITEQTAVVSLPPAHWADGGAIDLAAVGRRAREVGAAMVVDASQWLGAMPFDFDHIQPDFVITPGHKWLLGAYGLGWLWASPLHRDQGEPLEQTILAREAFGDFASMGQTLPPFRPGARRFDFGPYPHPVSVPMSIAALEQLERWGQETVSHELAERVSLLRAELEQRGLREGFAAGAVAEHYCSWLPPNPAASEAVRRALQKESVIVAWRGGRLRLSPHLHIDESQIRRVAELVAEAV